MRSAIIAPMLFDEYPRSNHPGSWAKRSLGQTMFALACFVDDVSAYVIVRKRPRLPATGIGDPPGGPSRSRIAG